MYLTLRIFLFYGLAITNLFGQQPLTNTPPSSKSVNNVANTRSMLEGEQLFQTYCSACHNFLQKGIGPSLDHVLLEVPASQVKSFIRNAPEQIGKGDSRGNQLYKEYKQLMPAFSMLKEGELDALLAYIGANQKKQLSKKELFPDGISDPIPARILPSTLVLHLDHYTTAPASSPAAPLARINKMAVLPGEKERVFIVDLQGKLYELVGKDWRVMLDMQRERPDFISKPGLGTGFGSFAFHPEFYQNGLLYSTHTEKANAAVADFSYPDSIKVTLQWVLTEWKVDPGASTFSGTSRELMRINMVSAIHGVQDIAFNPAARKGSDDYGLLYVGVGDGGATENGYPFLCGNQGRIWGTVLRIDPSGRNSRNGRYQIPKTNPYASDTSGATVNEIYCRGFRNPNRLCWTPAGKLLITDIGQAHVEELNLATAGADFGWPVREGTFVINPGGRMDQVYELPTNDAKFQYAYPVAQYDHDEGKAISGGFVYSGKAMKELVGKYLFGDINNGRLFFIDSHSLNPGKQGVIQEPALLIDGKQTTFQAISGKAKPDIRLGEGPQGAIYVLSKSDGNVYRVSSLTKRP